MVDKPLTVKQKKFVKAYVEKDGNGQEAAKAVYDVRTDGIARSIASENLTKPNIKYAIEQALEKHGITMDAAIAPIADGLKAVKYYEANDDGSATGQADHSTRLKASGMALKLMGADKGEAAQSPAVHFHQHIESKKGDYDF